MRHKEPFQDYWDEIPTNDKPKIIWTWKDSLILLGLVCGIVWWAFLVFVVANQKF